MIRGSIPFLWLCGPSGVGKSAVGYEIFQQVYGKAQNLAAVWPAYRTAGARCLIAVGGVTSRETVVRYAAKVPIRTSRCAGCATPEQLTVPPRSATVPPPSGWPTTTSARQALVVR